MNLKDLAKVADSKVAKPKKDAKKSTEDLVAEIKERGTITEQELLLLKRRASSGDGYADTITGDDEIELSPEQIEKGYAWLMNQWKSPAGKERKNNPFGYREQDVLEGQSLTMYFDQFYNPSRYSDFYVPVYTVSSSNGSFQYYVNDGEVNIIG